MLWGLYGTVVGHRGPNCTSRLVWSGAGPHGVHGALLEAEHPQGGVMGMLRTLHPQGGVMGAHPCPAGMGELG